MAGRGVIATEITALYGMVKLLRCGATLGISSAGGVRYVAAAMSTLIELLYRRLTLRIAIGCRVLGGAEAAGNVGLMELIGYRIIRIRCITAVGRIMLPVAGFTAQVVSRYFIEIIYLILMLSPLCW